jgi:4-amino-4-deoxyprephenate dehydrogenase
MESRQPLKVKAIEHCVLVGCNGQFGRVFAAKFLGEGIIVSGIDRQETPNEVLVMREYLQSDITQLTAAAQQLIRRAQCVLLCTPEQVVLKTIPVMRELIASDGLVVDIASVKSRIDAELKLADMSGSYLSIHPMFGPTTDFVDRNICIVPYGENDRSRWFAQLLSQWGGRVTTLTAQEHDQVTAYTQALPHAAILSFAATLVQAEVSYALTARLATPIHSTMLSLLARIISGESDLYWNIQSDNPYSAEMREQLGLSIRRLQEAVAGNDPDYLATLFSKISVALADDRVTLKDVASRIVDLAKGP